MMLWIVLKNIIFIFFLYCTHYNYNLNKFAYFVTKKINV